jgi:hypothetical protein
MARVTPKITPRTRKRTARKALGKARLEALVEEATIDAYGESEQRVGFLTMLEDRLAVPFTTDILGAPVRVERVDLNDADEIVAICRRGQQRQLTPTSISRWPYHHPSVGSGLRQSKPSPSASSRGTVFVERLPSLRPRLWISPSPDRRSALCRGRSCSPVSGCSPVERPRTAPP